LSGREIPLGHSRRRGNAEKSLLSDNDISFGVFFVRVLGPDQSIYALVLAGENDLLVPESLLGVPDLYAAILSLFREKATALMGEVG
jgi:hypothetical protein